MYAIGNVLLIGVVLLLLGGLAILAYMAIQNPRMLQSEKFQMDAMRLEHRHRKSGVSVISGPGRRNPALGSTMGEEN